jgi:hypothetical protein
MAKQFKEVDWEHLNLALKNKAVNYKYGNPNKPPVSLV